MPLIILPSKNNLGKGSAPYCVRSRCSETVEHEGLVERMAQAHTFLTKPIIEAVLELLLEVLAALLAEGKRVKLRFGAFYLCASGQLDSLTQAFKPEAEGGDHELRIHFSPNRSFEKDVASKVSLERQSYQRTSLPEIFSAASAQDRRESIARAGELIKVMGKRLSFKETDALTGLFFLDGTETRVSNYAVVIPSSILAQIPPELPPGNYTLAIRTRTGTGRLREGCLQDHFRVE